MHLKLTLNTTCELLPQRFWSLQTQVCEMFTKYPKIVLHTFWPRRNVDVITLIHLHKIFTPCAQCSAQCSAQFFWPFFAFLKCYKRCSYHLFYFVKKEKEWKCADVQNNRVKIDYWKHSIKSYFWGKVLHICTLCKNRGVKCCHINDGWMSKSVQNTVQN